MRRLRLRSRQVLRQHAILFPVLILIFIFSTLGFIYNCKNKNNNNDLKKNNVKTIKEIIHQYIYTPSSSFSPPSTPHPTRTPPPTYPPETTVPSPSASASPSPEQTATPRRTMNYPQISPIFAEKNEYKKNEIRKAFYFAWDGYKKNAFGFDVYFPLNKSGVNIINCSLLMIDSLTTLILMKFDDDVNLIKKHFSHFPDFANNIINTNRFVSIVYGGFLSAYQMTNDSFYLALLNSFHSLMPNSFESEFFSIENIKTTKGQPFSPRGEVITCVHQHGEIQLEILSFTNQLSMAKAVKRSLTLYKILFELTDIHGMVTDSIYGYNAEPTTNVYSLEVNGSSIFPNVVKSYILTKYSFPSLMNIFSDFWNSLKQKFIVTRNESSQNSSEKDEMFLRNSINKDIENKMNINTAFVPSMLLMGSLENSNFTEGKEQRKVAIELMGSFIKFCNLSYLCPFEILFDPETSEKPLLFNERYDFSPLLFESLLFFWRKTHDPKYREFAWNLFLKFNETCRCEHGFVNVNKMKMLNEVNPLLFSATFKYLYLIFSDDENELPETEWVFTNRGNPFKQWKETKFDLDKIPFGKLPPMYDPDVDINEIFKGLID